MPPAPPVPSTAGRPAPAVRLRTIAREWGRIGCIGFGGPPAHIALFQELCVQRRGWIDPEDFEHGITTTGLLPGPGSTQLSIYCAWRLRGVPGALVGGAAFILPGLVLIIALAALFLSSPPDWILGIGAGAGAVVAGVALHAGVELLRPGWARAERSRRPRWLLYLLAGAVATATVGPWLVVVLLGCGVIELLWRRTTTNALASIGGALPLVLAVAAAGGVGALCWTALKVGALSYGGGFVIVPMMQADAVDHFHWLTQGEFLNAVALGQATPGPVVHTVAVIGYGAFGVPGALLAAAIAFAPSFAFILLGAERFDRLRVDPSPRAFLDGAGPAAIGAILGSAIPLAQGISEGWQYAVLALGTVLLFTQRRGLLAALLLGAITGAVAAIAGAPLPT